MRTRSLLGLFISPLLLVGCDTGAGFGDDLTGPPEQTPPPGAPSTPPPTGSKWSELPVEGECGHTKLAFVLIDEVCGGTDDPHYMDYFHAPIMRDGAAIGSHLFAVDASYLWVLDVADPSDMSRASLLAGFGTPLSVGVHGGDIVLAAGEEGLLVVDVSDPRAPFRKAELPLDGPALDVFVEGDRALVAMGNAGVAVVDLAPPEPLLERVLEVPGFAAAAASRESVAYVAACDTFASFDLTSGALLGQSWLDNAHDENDILVAPAKDVALAGDVAFVAAGRFGAVAMDVSAPASPSIIGNCTEASDFLFYASGVRESGGTMYVAAGEYGVRPLDVSDPFIACTNAVIPDLPPPPSGEEACSSEPPWEVVPWVETWSPPPAPPPGQDPLQTFVAGDRLYAFGDATRIGLRAVDVRNPDDIEEKLGRYAEPRLTEGIAVQGDKLLLAGKRGGLYTFDAAGEISLAVDLPEAKLARATAFLGDGRWVLGGLAEDGTGSLAIENVGASSVAEPIWAGGMVTKAATVYVPLSTGVAAIDADGSVTVFPSNSEAHLPQAIAVAQDHLLVGAPEWTSVLRIESTGATPLGSEGFFTQSSLGNIGHWRKALPRRQLLVTPAGTVELQSVGGSAGVTLHDDFGKESAALPGGDYIAAATAGSRVFAVSVDRGRYRTQLVTIDLTSGPTVSSVIGFTGMASGIAASADKVFVADGDRGVRVYDTSDGDPSPIGIAELGEEAAP